MLPKAQVKPLLAGEKGVQFVPAEKQCFGHKL
jgi:hypothetical protein